jgi:hypothetical protein
MPEKDAAKSMVQRFKAIQEQAKKSEETPKPVSRKVSQFYYAKLQFSCTVDASLILYENSKQGIFLQLLKLDF